jgi:hypothetical protein
MCSLSTLFKLEPLKCSYSTSICTSGRRANILDQTTDLYTLGSVCHWQAQLSLKVSRPDIWHEVKQIISQFPQMETMHADGKNWKRLAVFGLDNSPKRERAQHEFRLSDVWKSGSWVYLRSLPIWLWLQFRYINQIALLWLLLSHINLHFIKSMKFGRTKKWLSILNPAVNFGLWEHQHMGLNLFA